MTREIDVSEKSGDACAHGLDQLRGDLDIVRFRPGRNLQGIGEPVLQLRILPADAQGDAVEGRVLRAEEEVGQRPQHMFEPGGEQEQQSEGQEKITARWRQGEQGLQ
ncbi:MAG: hypothetical protein BWY77_01347 [bacterium ADurb.Bin431]|nr:MAG: hypothetical protein BWY77_01347 [bacterium ADurb.Bin431]